MSWFAWHQQDEAMSGAMTWLPACTVLVGAPAAAAQQEGDAVHDVTASSSSPPPPPLLTVAWARVGLELLAVGGEDDSIAIYRCVAKPDGSVSLELVASVCDAHLGDVNTLAWHPTVPGLLLSGGDDGCVKLWHVTL